MSQFSLNFYMSVLIYYYYTPSQIFIELYQYCHQYYQTMLFILLCIFPIQMLEQFDILKTDYQLHFQDTTQFFPFTDEHFKQNWKDIDDYLNKTISLTIINSNLQPQNYFKIFNHSLSRINSLSFSTKNNVFGHKFPNNLLKYIFNRPYMLQLKSLNLNALALNYNHISFLANYSKKLILKNLVLSNNFFAQKEYKLWSKLQMQLTNISLSNTIVHFNEIKKLFKSNKAIQKLQISNSQMKSNQIIELLLMIDSSALVQLDISCHDFRSQSNQTLFDNFVQEKIYKISFPNLKKLNLNKLYLNDQWLKNQNFLKWVKKSIKQLNYKLQLSLRNNFWNFQLSQQLLSFFSSLDIYGNNVYQNQKSLNSIPNIFSYGENELFALQFIQNATYKVEQISIQNKFISNQQWKSFKKAKNSITKIKASNIFLQNANFFCSIMELTKIQIFQIYHVNLNELNNLHCLQKQNKIQKLILQFTHLSAETVYKFFKLISTVDDQKINNSYRKKYFPYLKHFQIVDFDLTLNLQKIIFPLNCQTKLKQITIINNKNINYVKQLKDISKIFCNFQNNYHLYFHCGSEFSIKNGLFQFQLLPISQQQLLPMINYFIPYNFSKLTTLIINSQNQLLFVKKLIQMKNISSLFSLQKLIISHTYNTHALQLLLSLNAPILRQFQITFSEVHNVTNSISPYLNSFLFKSNRISSLSITNTASFERIIFNLNFIYLQQLTLINASISTQALQKFILKHQPRRLFLSQVPVLWYQLPYLQLLNINSTFLNQYFFSSFASAQSPFLRSFKIKNFDINQHTVTKLLQQFHHKAPAFPWLEQLQITATAMKDQLLRLFLTHSPSLHTFEGLESENILNNILSSPRKVTNLWASGQKLSPLNPHLPKQSAWHLQNVQIDLNGFTSNDLAVLAALEWHQPKLLNIDVRQIYECIALHSLLTLAAKFQILSLTLINVQIAAFNSDCLLHLPLPKINHLQSITIRDFFHTTSIPHFLSLIAGSPTRIVLQGLKVGDQPIISILQGNKLNKLQVLKLQSLGLSDKALLPFQYITTQQLIVFSVQDNYLTSLNFMQKNTFTRLQHLTLSKNYFQGNITSNLIKLDFPKLKKLDLSRLAMTLSDLLLLSDLQAPNLVSLDISQNDITEQQLAQFIFVFDCRSFPFFTTLLANYYVTSGIYSVLSHVRRPFIVVGVIEQNHPSYYSTVK